MLLGDLVPSVQAYARHKTCIDASVEAKVLHFLLLDIRQLKMCLILTFAFIYDTLKRLIHTQFPILA